MQLTKNFTLKEVCYSDTARAFSINNIPTSLAIIDNLIAVCSNIAQPIRDKFGATRISSGYRCLELNRKIGSKDNSQHTKGQALDIDKVGNVSLRTVFNYIRDNLNFDQLLFETNSKGVTWIHVSYVSKAKNRHQVIDNYTVR